MYVYLIPQPHPLDRQGSTEQMVSAKSSEILEILAKANICNICMYKCSAASEVATKHSPFPIPHSSFGDH